jgi:hypothetical protein
MSPPNEIEQQAHWLPHGRYTSAALVWRREASALIRAARNLLHGMTHIRRRMNVDLRPVMLPTAHFASQRVDHSSDEGTRSHQTPCEFAAPL